MIDVRLATVGVTLLLFGLKLWEFFDLQYEKADERRQLVKKWTQRLPPDERDDPLLAKADRANKCLMDCFSGRTRFLWMWVPGLMLFALFPFVVLFQSIATFNLTNLLPQEIQAFLLNSEIEVWALIYFLSVSITTLGAMLGFIQGPVGKFQKARQKYRSYLDSSAIESQETED